MASADSVADVIEPLLEELLHSELNWFTVEFAPTEKKNKYQIKYCSKGKGGLTELRENLVATDRIFYGSLQVDLVDPNGSRYDKYIYFKYLPNKANKAKRHLWGWEQHIKTAFKFKHVMMEYLDENLTGFDEEGITKEFLRVSENQMEYTSLDFGGDNVYALKGGKIAKMPPKDMGKGKGKGQEKQKDAQDQKVDYPDPPQQQANEDNNNGNYGNDNGGGDDAGAQMKDDNYNDNGNANYNEDAPAPAIDSDGADVPDADADTYDAPPDQYNEDS